MRNCISKMTSIVIVVTMLASLSSCSDDNKKTKNRKKKVSVQVEEIDEEKTPDLSSYPSELVDLYNRNPETEDFVIDYYRNNYSHNIDLSKYDNCQYIPHFMQWDERWGYEEYNNNFLAVTGCGPTCLSMVAIYLTGNSTYSPLWMANFLDDHGYSVEGIGTAWSIFSDGVQCIDLYGYEIGTDEDVIEEYLTNGYPIICSMGPGDFTTKGHFVVITDYNNGYVSILDPNSNIRTRDWSFEELDGQMAQCWAMYVSDSDLETPEYIENGMADE